MDLVAASIREAMSRSSWIRRMFEAGRELKRRYGEDRVCDFSLGNPDLPPPPEVSQRLRNLAEELGRSHALGYMPNAGYDSTRMAIAELLSEQQGIPLRGEHIVVTCGAAGALNALFRAILELGEEVVCPSPYFVEYDAYVSQHGGRLKPVPSPVSDFLLDPEALAAAIGPQTRAVLLNSPNNPTGVIYRPERLEALGRQLERLGSSRRRPVFLVSDEPYRFLAYDGEKVPPVLPVYRYGVVVGSFSKSHSLAGERIGYLAVHPEMPGAIDLVEAVTLTQRTLGFVNAPAIGQRLVEATLRYPLPVEPYRRCRDIMLQVLAEAGLECVVPRGAFYVFPRTPRGMDDVRFCQWLQEELILAVPGRGFGCPGHFRLAYCVEERVIARSSDGFRRTVERALREG